MLLSLYRGLTALSAPFLRPYLAHRRTQGKEHPTRYTERFGLPGLPRPAGKLLWIHSASNGEFLSVAPLVPLLLADKPDWSVLMTSGTLSAASSFDTHGATFPAGRVLHQFVPVDHPVWVERFMAHWRPDAAIWMESELWPNLLRALRTRGVPVILLNARMRPKTARRWRHVKGTVRDMVSTFHTVCVMAAGFAPVFAEFGAKRVKSFGNLKIDKPPLPVDDAALQELKQRIGPRRVIGAIQTHPTDETAFAAAFARLKTDHPDLLGVIVPKHPARSADIKTELVASGLRVAVRSLGEPLTPDTDIYIADTFNEMGLWYTLCLFGLIGGSLFPFGGQNPYEGIHFGFVPVYGPHMFNFPDTTAILEEHDIAVPLQAKADLYPAMKHLLEHPDVLTHKQNAARRVAAESVRILEPTADYIRQQILSS